MYDKRCTEVTAEVVVQCAQCRADCRMRQKGRCSRAAVEGSCNAEHVCLVSRCRCVFQYLLQIHVLELQGKRVRVGALEQFAGQNVRVDRYTELNSPPHFAHMYQKFA